MQVFVIIFWVAVGLVVYTLVGYPLLCVVLAALRPRPIDKRPITPRVTMIIAAYNEEDVIGEKLRQTLELDYPREQLEIMVASDGSSDRTDEIVGSFADRGVRLYRSEGRVGKTATLNGAVACATGEIIVFSDATGDFNRESLRELVANFNDATVGCVTGRVAYRYGADATSRGFRAYQRFVVPVRLAESRWGSQTSVSGSIHAMRRALYRPTNPAFSLDVIDAVHTVAAGQRVVYEYNAVSLEQARGSARDEFRCRVRIGVRGWSMMPYILRELVHAGRWSYLFQMISHKFARWWLWFFLLTALVSGAVLAVDSPFYRALTAAQLGGYALGMVGLVLRNAGARVPLLSSLALFLLGNAAVCIGALKCIAGGRMAAWQPVREAPDQVSSA